MGKYLRKQFQTSQFLLEHHCPSVCYLSCWQNNRSPLPLLCLRVIILLGCLAILLASLILTPMSIGHWFIFLTHWGLIINTVASCFGVVVSLKAYLNESMDPFGDLPWYSQVFWATYNIAIVHAFFITICYCAFLLLRMTYEVLADVELSLDPLLDMFVHGVNSILMFLLLMTSRLPGHILHFVYPLGFGTVYLLFSVVYYFAGGVDPFGNNFIYPILDWTNLGVTSGMLVLTAILLIAMHEIVVLITAFRNWLSRRCGGHSSSSLDIPYS